MSAGGHEAHVRAPARWLRRALIAVIRVYQLLLSPLVGPVCRFEPSCSAYACSAIASHGVIRGGWLAAARIRRCHPWGGVGYDPVP